MSYLAQFASLLCAGTMMVTSSLQTIAPQRDIDGSLFLVNRTYRISEDYVPQVVQADVSGSLRSMRPEAAAALEEMFAACKEEAGVTLVTVSGYRSYQKQKNIYNNKLKSVGGSEEKADEYVARPGASEHQLGMAMDVGQRNSSAGLTSSLPTPRAGRGLRKTAGASALSCAIRKAGRTSPATTTSPGTCVTWAWNMPRPCTRPTCPWKPIWRICASR